jgi:hypothetical protein
MCNICVIVFILHFFWLYRHAYISIIIYDKHHHLFSNLCVELTVYVKIGCDANLEQLMKNKAMHILIWVCLFTRYWLRENYFHMHAFVSHLLSMRIIAPSFHDYAWIDIYQGILIFDVCLGVCLLRHLF